MRRNSKTIPAIFPFDPAESSRLKRDSKRPEALAKAVELHINGLGAPTSDAIIQTAEMFLNFLSGKESGSHEDSR